MYMQRRLFSAIENLLTNHFRMTLKKELQMLKPKEQMFEKLSINHF